MGIKRYHRNELLTIRDSLASGVLEQVFHKCLVLPLKHPILRTVFKDSSSREGMNLGRTRFRSGSIPHEDEVGKHLYKIVKWVWGSSVFKGENMCFGLCKFGR
jgi:hypothetical protein